VRLRTGIHGKKHGNREYTRAPWYSIRRFVWAAIKMRAGDYSKRRTLNVRGHRVPPESAVQKMPHANTEGACGGLADQGRRSLEAMHSDADRKAPSGVDW
jgi:hypothetical protein